MTYQQTILGIDFLFVCLANLISLHSDELIKILLAIGRNLLFEDAYCAHFSEEDGAKRVGGFSRKAAIPPKLRSRIARN